MSLDKPNDERIRALTPLKRARYLGESLGFFAMMGLFKALGLGRASAFGGFLGRHIFYRLPPMRLARRNFKAAFPDMEDGEVERTLREMADNLGRTVAEYPHFRHFALGGEDPRIEVRGVEHFERARARGKGVILFSGHLANWEIMPVTARSYGLESALVYRPLNNPFADRWMTRQRTAFGAQEAIAKGPRGTRRIFSVLRKGGTILMLVDQRTSEGVPVPFFGRPAMTTPAPAALALKLGAALVPATNERLDGARFRMTVHPELVFRPCGDFDRDTVALTAEITAAMERFIRARPSQWLWVHNRWPMPTKPRKRAQLLAGDGVRAESAGSSLS